MTLTRSTAKYLVWSVLALVVGLLLLPLVAMAQPAPAASAASAPDLVLTRDTACGAPGVGIAGATGLPEKRDVVPPNKRVNSDGHWVMDPKCMQSKPPKDCPEQPAPTYWQVRNKVCVSPPGAKIPGRSVSPADVTVFSAGYFSATPPYRKGTQTYECQRDPEGATGWVLIKQYCQ